MAVATQKDPNPGMDWKKKKKKMKKIIKIILGILWNIQWGLGFAEGLLLVLDHYFFNPILKTIKLTNIMCIYTAYEH